MPQSPGASSRLLLAESSLHGAERSRSRHDKDLNYMTCDPSRAKLVNQAAGRVRGTVGSPSTAAPVAAGVGLWRSCVATCRRMRIVCLRVGANRAAREFHGRGTVQHFETMGLQAHCLLQGWASTWHRDELLMPNVSRSKVRQSLYSGRRELSNQRPRARVR